MSETAGPADDAAARKLPTLLTGRAEFLAGARRLVMQARYGVSLISDELDHRVFGHESFTDAVKHFALLNRHAHMRVLVMRPQAAIASPNALLDFGRLLASRIEFREANTDKPVTRGEWLIADGRLILQRSAPDATEAFLTLEDPATARERQRKFDQYWNESLPSPQLRRMRL